MKVAIIHELLTMKGGAERVAKIFADMFPDAPVYTLLYEEKIIGDWFPASRVRTGFTQQVLSQPRMFMAWLLHKTVRNHHYYLKYFPRAVEAWDFSAFDVVISSSSAFAHGIITNGKPKHICYVHSPARYLWDRTHDVANEWSTGILGPLRRFYLSRTFHPLRIWDSEAADRADVLIAPSREVQRRIELYWRRESEIIHPPIDDYWLGERHEARGLSDEPYFFMASTLARYKRIDIAIKAANEAGVKLIIAGEGADKKRLMKLAGPTVTFVGFKNREELRDLYANAQATIFPGEEDFGLVPLESMACGTPVIAYKKGGALETVTEGKTGMFFDDEKKLPEIMKNWKKSSFDETAMRNYAREFSRETFEKLIKERIEKY